MISKSSQRLLLALGITLQWSLVLAFPDAPTGANSTASNSTKSGNSTSADKKATSSVPTKPAKSKKKEQDERNWATVRAFLFLWLGLFALFGISLIVLVLRRYIRTVASLSPGNTQAYFAPVNRHWGWLKKHFIFAPLFHKRHHRPFMITRTMDNGCLPSRPQTFILVTYFILLVAATFYNINYTTYARLDTILAVSRRAGMLALSQLIPLFILAARNNPLIWWTGISFDTYNLFHRWLGRFVVFEVFIHATTYFMRKIEREGWAGYKKTLGRSEFTRAGTIVRILV
jgi:hypothetical protein